MVHFMEVLVHQSVMKQTVIDEEDHFIDHVSVEQVHQET
jgi:hypothetical protein